MENQETNDWDILRGKKINEMERLFQKRLDEIEKSHIEYFAKRPATRQVEEYDRLHNHYVYHQSGDYANLFG